MVKSKSYVATYRRRETLTREIQELNARIAAVRNSAETQAVQDARSDYVGGSVGSYQNDREYYTAMNLGNSNYGELVRKRNQKQRELASMGRGQMALFNVR